MKPLAEGELRFAELVWEQQPLGSGELVRLCAERFDWKKSTTYTVLSKLCERGLLQNRDSVVTALVDREQYDRLCAGQFVADRFGGSLPGFLTAFIGGRGLTEKQADELKKLIDSHREV